MSNNKVKIFFIFFITLALLYLLYYSKYLFEIVPPIVSNGRIFLFGDWTAIVSAIKCDNLGLNVFLENPCDPLKRVHVYGSSFLLLPTITKFKFFFFLIFPIIFLIAFVAIVLILLKPSNHISLAIYFLAIFNPSTLLLFERFNFDLIIFLGMILITFTNNHFIKFFTLILVCSMKFWSIIFGSIYLFFEKKKFIKNLLLIILSLSLFSLLIFIEYENLKLISQNSSQITASKYFIFGIDAFEKIANSKFKLISNYPIFFTYLILILSFFLFFSIEKNSLNISYSGFDQKEYQLLILSSLTLTIMFFAFDNVYYREVFLIGCLPFFIKHQNQKFFRLLLYFIIFRYLIFIFARIFFKEFGIDWLYLLKNFLDLILISNLLIIILYFIYNLYKKIFQLV
ncbi:hypothetical protein N9U51_00240 [Candidatus Pelagibacter sp.]|nr:hypothetical protein [Candidatus Pelagibacter sp.]